MKAEIINVGTELLLGHTINTDAALVARALASLGIDLEHTQTVGDNAARLEEALSLALGRADMVITTGGLGPTCDDLTKQVVAKVCNAPLEPDDESENRLAEYFGSRPMTENQHRQSLIPHGSAVFANEHGTAPGMATPFGDGKFVVLLPGPPRELEPMLENMVLPFLAGLSHSHLYSIQVRTFGIGEGAAAEMLDSLLQGSNPTAATYAGDGEMFVRITAKGASAEEAKKLAEDLACQVKKILGNVVYGENVSSLEEVVVRKLIGENKTIATAESCTGGLLAGRITNVPGSSAIFHLGLVTYANSAKQEILHVPANLLGQYGAVSPQVAEAMAVNVRQLANADFGVGITGIAGPDGGTMEKPVGLVYIALAHAQGCVIRRMQPQGRYPGRDWTRRRATSIALDLARRHLWHLPPE